MNYNKNSKNGSRIIESQDRDTTIPPEFGSPGCAEYWRAQASQPITRLLAEFTAEMDSIRRKHAKEIHEKVQEIAKWKMIADSAMKDLSAVTRLMTMKGAEVTQVKSEFAIFKQEVAQEKEENEKMCQALKCASHTLTVNLHVAEANLQASNSECRKLQERYEATKCLLEDNGNLIQRFERNARELCDISKSMAENMRKGRLEEVHLVSVSRNPAPIASPHTSKTPTDAATKGQMKRRNASCEITSVEEFMNPKIPRPSTPTQAFRREHINQSEQDRGETPLVPTATKQQGGDSAVWGWSTSAEQTLPAPQPQPVGFHNPYQVGIKFI